MGERGGGYRMQSWRVRMDRAKRKGQDSKNRGAGGVGFLVKNSYYYVCHNRGDRRHEI